MDERSARIRYDLAKELFEVLKKIFDARNQRRAKIFAREIAPMMEKMRANHSDFLEIISVLTILNTRLISIFEEKINDVTIEIAQILRDLQKLTDIRDKRRIERREIFEEAIWQHGYIDEGQKFRSISLPR